jgi:hypothetical protein
MVTVLLGSAVTGDAQLVTWVGVESGDSLAVTDSLGVTAPVQRWQMTSLPSGAAPGGTPNFFNVYGPCATDSFPVGTKLPVQGTCNWSGPFPVLVVATNSSTYAPFGFVFDKTAFDADGGLLSVGFGPSWSAVGTLNVTVTNTLGAAPQVDHDEYADGYAFSFGSTQASTDVDAGTESETFTTFPGLPDFVQTEALTGSGIVAQRSDTLVSSVTLDLSRQLPPILAGGIDSISSPSRPQVAWTPATQAAFGDGTYVYLRDGLWSWTFLVPPGATRVQAPELPQVDGGAWAPSDSFETASLVIATVEADAVGGYAAFRAGGTALFPVGLVSPPLPSAGNYAASVLTH